MFGKQSSQQDVYDEVSQLVRSFLDGNNVCIFSYGQTGSGKTHTMGTDSTKMADDSQLGIVPRAVRQIIDVC